MNDMIKVPAPTTQNHIVFMAALSSTSSAVEFAENESVISPNIRENNGIAEPLIKAASDPIPISNLSEGVANDRSLEKGTMSSAFYSLLFF
jgi:hypothetical protein